VTSPFAPADRSYSSRPSSTLSVESKRNADGRWPLDHAYHDASHVDLGEAEGGPSRWNTLRALRILRWAGRWEPAASATSASA
jgi:hypothetical protein